MISAKALRKKYVEAEGRELRVLDGLSLEVAQGEFVAVVGPSGSGKSTLLHVLGGLDVDYQGQVQVAGKTLTGLSDKELAAFRNEQVGFVFQSFHLIPNLTALQNVTLPGFFGKRARTEDEQRAAAALDRVGLWAKKDRAPPQLSGGERQRVAIARALFMQPRVLFCDEPTGNLDARTGAEIIDLFKALHGEGLTLLAVTHEDRMSSAAQRTLRLKEGLLVPEGAAA
ncbi:MAG: ABC transporter ATP-binding protein [Myxococcaceae bacterium]